MHVALFGSVTAGCGEPPSSLSTMKLCLDCSSASQSIFDCFHFSRFSIAGVQRGNVRWTTAKCWEFTLQSRRSCQLCGRDDSYSYIVNSRAFYKATSTTTAIVPEVHEVHRCCLAYSEEPSTRFELKATVSP